MIRTTQHFRLARPVSQRLARRLVWKDSRYAGARTHDGSASLTLPAATRLSSLSSRTFSSSRPYATTLHSDSLSTSPADALPTPGASSTRQLRPSLSSQGQTQPLDQTILISAPSREALEELGEELVPDSEARFQISERAAEVIHALYLT